jgi:hypothetical protein
MFRTVVLAFSKSRNGFCILHLTHISVFRPISGVHVFLVRNIIRNLMAHALAYTDASACTHQSLVVGIVTTKLYLLDDKCNVTSERKNFDHYGHTTSSAPVTSLVMYFDHSRHAKSGNFN